MAFVPSLSYKYKVVMRQLVSLPEGALATSGGASLAD